MINSGSKNPKTAESKAPFAFDVLYVTRTEKPISSQVSHALNECSVFL